MKYIITILVFFTVNLVYSQDNYNIKNIDVNTKYHDFGVSYYGNEAVFASSKKDNNLSKKNWKDGQPYLELYKGTIGSNGEIFESELFSKKIASKYHESNAVFTKDLKTVYFTRSNFFRNRYGKDKKGWNNLKMFKADVADNGDWSNITPLPFNNDDYSVGHPALSPDNKTLYFTSDMPGSIGATDIFSVKINVDGTFGTPENLGNQVNTPGKEMFPFVSKNNELYFSSDGKGGLGGLDVFVINLKDLSVKAKNIEAPVNSISDDFSFIIDDNYKTGYFSSDRLGGHGSDDIYYFEKEVKEKKCTQSVHGLVKEKLKGELIPDAIVRLYDGVKIIDRVVVGTDGKFKFNNLKCSNNYRVTGEKEFYNGAEKSLITTKKADLDINLDLSLDAVKLTDKDLDRCQYALDNINPIYFDLDQYNIRIDAAMELEKVVRTMIRCSGIVVEVRSHTDSRQTESYNLTLSQNRAQSTINYIISRGIDKSRLIPTGYGESKILNKCVDGVKCTEAEHQINRRTEFIIKR